MLHYRRSMIACVGLMGTLWCAVAEGQAPTGIPAACTYRTCALRVEPDFLGAALVRGASNEKVSRIGGFGGGVGVLLAGPDSAARYAHAYVHAKRGSTVLGILAGVAAGIVLVRADDSSDWFETTDVVISLVGVGFGLASIPFTIKAQRSLSRSVWWYNAELPH